MEKKLKIVGKGKISVAPDLTRLNMTLEGTEKEYAKALEASSQMTSKLQEILMTVGFQKSDLKTVGFQVDTYYEDFQENGDWKHEFAGYKYVHSMKVEFSVDSERLGRILAAFGEKDVPVQFHVQYTVADPDAVKEKLLVDAIAKSKEKAQIISKAAGVELGEIVEVDYSWEAKDFGVGGLNGLIPAGTALRSYRMTSFDLNVQPDDIVIEDSVTVTWSIR